MKKEEKKLEIKKALLLLSIIFLIAITFFFLPLQEIINSININGGEKTSKEKQAEKPVEEKTSSQSNEKTIEKTTLESEKKELLSRHDYENNPSIRENDFNYETERGPQGGSNSQSNSSNDSIPLGEDDAPFIKINECTQNCLEAGETIEDCSIICSSGK